MGDVDVVVVLFLHGLFQWIFFFYQFGSKATGSPKKPSIAGLGKIDPVTD